MSIIFELQYRKQKHIMKNYIIFYQMHLKQ